MTNLKVTKSIISLRNKPIILLATTKVLYARGIIFPKLLIKENNLPNYITNNIDSLPNNKNNYSKIKNRQKRIIISIFILLLVIVVLFGIKITKRYNLSKNIKKEVIINVQSEVTISDFLYDSTSSVYTDIDLSSLKAPGSYDIKITIDGEQFISKLIIKDMDAPEFEVKDISIYIDEKAPIANDFITEINEYSNYTIKEISYDKTVGEHTIDICIIDEFGNETVKKAKLIIKEDKEPPTISGLTPISTEIGNKINLTNGVSSYDKRFGKMEFTIDDSKVNYSKPGEYKIYYHSQDTLGNKTTQVRKITLKEKNITYLINNFPTYSQYPNYPNGCESIALYNLLRFYKINVSPEDIVNRLKKGDKPYRVNNILYGGNPEIEFVGDPRDAHGYGVYQKPIIDVANYYKKGIIDYTGHSLNDVLGLVKKKIPVQVWVSINLKDTKICTSWTYKPTGQKINWICNLHSVIVVGYNKNVVYVSDSYTGKIESYNKAQFEKMYNLFGKRALYYAK